MITVDLLPYQGDERQQQNTTADEQHYLEMALEFLEVTRIGQAGSRLRAPARRAPRPGKRKKAQVVIAVYCTTELGGCAFILSYFLAREHAIATCELLS